jgi:phosphoglycolate phosphatase
MQAVIFDLDGTLLDTTDDLGAALNHVLTKHGLPTVTKEIYSPAISDGVKALLEVGFGPLLANYDVEILRQDLLDYYANNIAVHTECFIGIPDLIDKLITQGIKVGIMTNKPTFLTRPLISKIAALSKIEVVVCGDTLEEAKPSPKPLLFAANQLGIDAQNCIYVGDAERDIQAAKAADMMSVAALWGYIPSLEIAKSWQADQNLTSPISLLEHI